MLCWITLTLHFNSARADGPIPPRFPRVGTRVMMLLQYSGDLPFPVDAAYSLNTSCLRVTAASERPFPNPEGDELLKLRKGETLISDYTVLPVGTRVEDGEVKVCPKCQRRGLHVEVDGHCFYTHFQIRNSDDPRSVFIRRVECHLLAGEIAPRNPCQALPQFATPST